MSKQWDNQSYYEILEVSPEATNSEINEAYQRAKATYSQDNPTINSLFSKEETLQLLNLIEEAYTILGNKSSRQAYDQNLHRNSQKDEDPAMQFLRSASGQSGTTTFEDLPQFENPEDMEVKNPWEEPGPVQPNIGNGNGNELPGNMGKTPFGFYEKNADMENAVEERADFDGEFLAQIRQYKKIDLTELSNKTRISKTYLVALEANDYKSLPAPVFVRGFIVQLARLYGLNEKKVASSYLEIMKGRNL